MKIIFIGDCLELSRVDSTDSAKRQTRGLLPWSQYKFIVCNSSFVSCHASLLANTFTFIVAFLSSIIDLVSVQTTSCRAADLCVLRATCFPAPAETRSVVHCKIDVDVPKSVLLGVSRESGMIFKQFRSTPNPQGYFFSLKVRKGGVETEVSVPLSKDEFRLFQIIAEYCIPNLMGIDKVFVPEVSSG